MIHFIMDESVDLRLKSCFAKGTMTVLSIAREHPGLNDDEVLALAYNKDAVLITEDKDFGDIIFRLKKNHAGILLLRLAGVPLEEKIALINNFLKEHLDKVKNSMSVLSENSVRIRKPL